MIKQITLGSFSKQQLIFSASCGSVLKECWDSQTWKRFWGFWGFSLNSRCRRGFQCCKGGLSLQLAAGILAVARSSRRHKGFSLLLEEFSLSQSFPQGIFIRIYHVHNTSRIIEELPWANRTVRVQWDASGPWVTMSRVDKRNGSEACFMTLIKLEFTFLCMLIKTEFQSAFPIGRSGAFLEPMDWLQTPKNLYGSRSIARQSRLTIDRINPCNCLIRNY